MDNDNIRRITGFNYSNELIELIRNVHKEYAESTADKRIIGTLRMNNPRWKMFEILNTHIRIEGKKILEAGVCTGQNLAHLAMLGAEEIVGIDIDQQYFHMAEMRFQPFLRKGTRIDLIEADIISYPLKSNRFDIVVCVQLLEHLGAENQEFVVQKLWDSLKPGGVLYIQVPNKTCPIDSHDSMLPFAHWLPRRISKPYALLFKRLPPINYPISYRRLLKIINSLSDSQILNRVDICSNVQEFIRYRWQRGDVFSKVLAIVGTILHLVTFGNINYLLPNANLFIMKIKQIRNT